LRLESLRNWLVLIGGVGLLLVVDQASKVWVRANLAVGEAWAPIPALSQFFTFTHVRNTGVAFGSLPGLGWLFMLVNLVVLIGILVYYPRIPAGHWPMRLSLILIAAGDLGNVIDRLRTTALFIQETGSSLWTALPHAYVTDFVDIKIWPVWNVADMCIVGGTMILALILWQAEKTTSTKSATVDDEDWQSSIGGK
jgi:signal peptidase II